MKVTYAIGLKVTVDRDNTPLKKSQVQQIIANFFANPQPLPANTTVSDIVVKNVEIEDDQ